MYLLWWEFEVATCDNDMLRSIVLFLSFVAYLFTIILFIIISLHFRIQYVTTCHWTGILSKCQDLKKSPAKVHFGESTLHLRWSLQNKHLGGGDREECRALELLSVVPCHQGTLIVQSWNIVSYIVIYKGLVYVQDSHKCLSPVYEPCYVDI